MRSFIEMCGKFIHSTGPDGTLSGRESMVRLWILIYFEYYPTEVNSFFEKDAFDSI